MNRFFDGLGNMLNDIIGSPENNNVKFAMKQFAGGGLESDTNPDPLSMQNIINSAAKATQQTSRSIADNSLGGGFYNSPAYIASHYSQLGKFFNSADTGGTNKPITPSKGIKGIKPDQATDPNEFYARWYNKMRQFAEAREVSDMGQVKVTTR